MLLECDCRYFAPKVNPELISHPSDLVNRFGFLFARFARFAWVAQFAWCCVIGIYHNLSCQILATTGVTVGVAPSAVDVSGKILYAGGDSVRARQSVLVSGDTCNKDWLLVTTLVYALSGGNILYLGVRADQSVVVSSATRNKDLGVRAGSLRRECIPGVHPGSSDRECREFAPGVYAGSYTGPSRYYDLCCLHCLQLVFNLIWGGGRGDSVRTRLPALV